MFQNTIYADSIDLSIDSCISFQQVRPFLVVVIHYPHHKAYIYIAQHFETSHQFVLIWQD